MAERWRPVVGYEGVYDVSDHGRVRRVRHGRGAVAGRILRAHDWGGGYLAVQLHARGGRRLRAVHLLVAEAFLGPTPAGMEVNHEDGDKHNPRLSNLEHVTRGRNIAHAYGLGLFRPRRGPRGLTAEQADTLTAEYHAGGVTYAELAVRHGLSGQAIGRHIRANRKEAA